MFRFLKVTGDSLQPLYQPGDFVLICKIPAFFGRVRPGDVIVFRHPLHGTLIKIVGEVFADAGEIFVIGTHAGSIDSRQFGPIRASEVVGKVVWHFRRPSQAA